MDRRRQEIPSADRVTLRFEGEEVAARAGESVAVALFAAGVGVLSRSVKYHRPRGLFCLAGHCGSCLMRIDGQPNIRACRTPVREGLRVERQNAFPSAGFDVLGAADFLFGKGMDHHKMMTSPRALNAVLNKVVRQLGGLGKLPDPPTDEVPPLPQRQRRHFDVVVVGGGPAGLACATLCARAGKRTLVVDEQDRVGGSLLAAPQGGLAAAEAAEAAARAAGVTLLSSSTAIAWYGEDVAMSERPGLLAVHAPTGLLEITADRYVYATGSYEQNALFVDNDRPGVLPARAVGRLLARFDLVPGKRPVVVGDGPYARALAEALAKAGTEVTRIDGIEEQIVAARGHSWIRAVDTSKGRTLKCDLLAVAARPAPASELPRQHGVPVEFALDRGGFGCRVDDEGRTPIADVYACGDVTGFGGPGPAAQAGTRCGEAVVRSFGARP